MTDHAVLAYGDEGDEGFLPLGDQPNQLGFQWATEGFRVDFLNRGAVAWLLERISITSRANSPKAFARCRSPEHRRDLWQLVAVTQDPLQLPSLVAFVTSRASTPFAYRINRGGQSCRSR